MLFTLLSLTLKPSLSSGQDNNSNELHPGWSPDGNYLIFYSNRTGNNEIYKLEVRQVKALG